MRRILEEIKLLWLTLTYWLQFILLYPLVWLADKLFGDRFWGGE